MDCNGACVRPGTKTLPLQLGWGRGTTVERGAGARPLHPLLVHQPQHLQRLLCHLPAGLHSGCLRGHLTASLPLRTEDRGAAGGRDWGQRGEAMLGLGPPVLCGAGCQHSVGLSDSAVWGCQCCVGLSAFCRAASPVWGWLRCAPRPKYNDLLYCGVLCWATGVLEGDESWRGDASGTPGAAQPPVG